MSVLTFEQLDRPMLQCSEAATSVVFCRLSRLWTASTDGKPGWREALSRLQFTRQSPKRVPDKTPPRLTVQRPQS